MNILVLLATFLAAGVEWVEALTIVLAVGLVKGWWSAFVGMVLALLALIALIVGFGLAITSHVSIAAARTVVGVFLLLFGIKWLHKAILRSSGLAALHDEAKAFEKTLATLGITGSRAATLDRAGIATSFGGVFLEGLEVVFIVVALGGLQSVTSSALGAVAALIVVAAIGVALRRPLTQVPENTMKYVVGVMLTSFGTFFAGEGIGVQWWHDDVSLPILIGAYGLASLLFVVALRLPASASSTVDRPFVRGLATAVKEVWGLFVGDGAVAILAIVVLIGVTLFVDRFSGQRGLAALLLVAGVLTAVGVGLATAHRESRRRSTAATGTSSQLGGPTDSSDSRAHPETIAR